MRRAVLIATVAAGALAAPALAQPPKIDGWLEGKEMTYHSTTQLICPWKIAGFDLRQTITREGDPTCNYMFACQAGVNCEGPPPVILAGLLADPAAAMEAAQRSATAQGVQTLPGPSLGQSTFLVTERGDRRIGLWIKKASTRTYGVRATINTTNKSGATAVEAFVPAWLAAQKP